MVKRVGLPQEAGSLWFLDQGHGSPVPVECSPSLPVAAVLLLELLALEPADASAPVAAGPGEDGRGGWKHCGPQLALGLVLHWLHHVHWVIYLL